MSVRVSNDLLHWIRFFLSGVAETAVKEQEVFRQVLALRTEVEQAALSLGKRSASARLALSFLYRKPMVSFQELQKALSITSPTANALIQDFERLGILKEMTGQQRHRLYCFERYLGLFLS